MHPPATVQKSPMSITTSNFVRSLLENKNLPAFKIHCHLFEFNWENFVPIATGAISGNLNNFMKFVSCSFDETSTDVFEIMFAPNSNLCGLELASLVSFTKPTQIILAKIFYKDSPLKRLDIDLSGNPEDGIMMCIMIALELNTLLHFL